MDPSHDPAPQDAQPPHGQAPMSADHRLLHPDDVVLSGPYVRQHVDEAELAALTESILAGGEIKQAIGVRTEGSPESPRYVLVYGMRRWMASRSRGTGSASSTGPARRGCPSASSGGRRPCQCAMVGSLRPSASMIR